MAINSTEFEQEFFVQWVSDMNKLVDDAETWFGNMVDQNVNYDYTSAQSTLKSLRSTFESDLETLQAAL